jgi:hypothetical protein
LGLIRDILISHMLFHGSIEEITWSCARAYIDSFGILFIGVSLIKCNLGSALIVFDFIRLVPDGTLPIVSHHRRIDVVDGMIFVKEADDSVDYAQ